MVKFLQQLATVQALSIQLCSSRSYPKPNGIALQVHGNILGPNPIQFSNTNAAVQQGTCCILWWQRQSDASSSSLFPYLGGQMHFDRISGKMLARVGPLVCLEGETLFSSIPLKYCRVYYTLLHIPSPPFRNADLCRISSLPSMLNRTLKRVFQSRK